ncbi:flagellar protein FliJ [Methylophaga lonarensis MPL]|uniref:Flagellar FliJ protein n=1 Tax=Methylophaga lonarensis MPL TaxID=1286106 RepID=M7P438_9GAMM|nr:flagellar export protein FliJ [Methylophaga lonarensis]EMR14277.1 flagellar protein FliJ [Methylophaga lonarensis MPL]
MNRAAKLSPVVKMASQAVEQAARGLAEANAVLQRDQQQLDSLLQYREEYLQRFRRADPMHMPAQKALELRAFLAQLDQAITLQEQQIQRSRKIVNQHQQHWQEKRQREQAVQTLVTRYQIEQRQQLSRKEQSEADEHSMALWKRIPR